MTFREFSTLCAVNSVLGFNQDFALIRRDIIRARQRGYKSKAVWKAYKPKGDLEALSVQQVRDTLDRLEDIELIKRVQISMRNVVFSTRLSYEELSKQTESWSVKKDTIASRRAQERLRFLKKAERTT